MNHTELQQVRDALSINRVMAKDSDGNYTREVTPKLITDAIALCEASLARVVEPVGTVSEGIATPGYVDQDDGSSVWCEYKYFRATVHLTRPIEDGTLLYATPQAAAQPSQAVDPLTYSQRVDIATQWFSDESDISRALQMLTDFEQTSNAKGAA